MISAIEGFGIYVYRFNNSDIDTDSCIEFYLDAGYKKKNVFFMLTFFIYIGSKLFL